MGIICLVLGESGSGKSSSLRNFTPDEVGVFNVASKPLPFKTKLKVANQATYEMIKKALRAPTLKRYVVDDSQFLLAFESFKTAKVKGFDKFVDMAVNFYEMLKFVTDVTPPDVVVYFLHHTETLDTGKVKAKTIGKMLDQQLTIEGLFSIVLLCKADNGSHFFETQSNGFSPAKSPMGMFDSMIIDNDLKLVDDAIRKYWEL